MNIEEIKKEAQKKIDERENSRAVDMYMSLLALRKEAQKQIKQIDERIKMFEENPEEFVEENEEIWF